MSPLARIPSRGLAFQEVVVTAPGLHELEFRLADGTREFKLLAAGDVQAPMLQPERVRSFWRSFMWPAEDRFPADSPFSRVSIHYPDGELVWLPDGAGGIVIVFILASMVFGFAMLLDPHLFNGTSYLSEEFDRTIRSILSKATLGPESFKPDHSRAIGSHEQNSLGAMYVI